MSVIAQELLSQLAVLSKEDRMVLAAYLLDQLQEDDDQEWRAAWLEELRRRESNPQYVSAETVFGKYRKSAP